MCVLCVCVCVCVCCTCTAPQCGHEHLAVVAPRRHLQPPKQLPVEAQHVPAVPQRYRGGGPVASQLEQRGGKVELQGGTCASSGRWDREPVLAVLVRPPPAQQAALQLLPGGGGVPGLCLWCMHAQGQACMHAFMGSANHVCVGWLLLLKKNMQHSCVLT